MTKNSINLIDNLNYSSNTEKITNKKETNF